MSQAHEVEQHLDEVRSLRARLGTGRWQEEDWGMLERVLGAYERLLSMLCEAQLTLKRLQTLRCSACGQVFTAPLPPEAGTEKYSPRARAVLAVSRYYLGLPFFRVEAYQAMLGVPVPDATQWDQIERVADCGYVVFAHLE